MASAEDSSDVVMEELAFEEIEESLPETTATPATTSKVTDETPVEAVSVSKVTDETPVEAVSTAEVETDEMPVVEAVSINEVAVETSVEEVSNPELGVEMPVEAVSKPEVAGENAPTEEDEDETGSPGFKFSFDNDLYISSRPFGCILDAIFTKQLMSILIS